VFCVQETIPGGNEGSNGIKVDSIFCPCEYKGVNMDKVNKEKIEQVIKNRKHAHHSLVRKKSPVYKSFLQLEKAAFASRSLSKQTKELMAVGISVVINCESCMEWHIHEALKEGATEDQVLEAIEVGIEMGGGPATVSARFALQVVEYYRESGI
jgi:AhpD family alkylhydroperoxidase